MNINISVSDNFSVCFDKKTGMTIYVDTFDHYTFDVRIGSVSESVVAGVIEAGDNEELNEKIAKLFEEYQRNQ